jgi:hypothetical protein
MAYNLSVLRGKPAAAIADIPANGWPHKIETVTVFIIGLAALVYALLEFFGWSFLGWSPLPQQEKGLVLAGISLLLVASSTEAFASTTEAARQGTEIRNLRETLKTEIAQNEDRTEMLWHAFRKVLGDENFESALRGTIRYYAERRKLDQDDAMVTRALQDIERARATLEDRRYDVFFYGIVEYPQLFYENAVQEIVATNVVKTDYFWSRHLKQGLLKMNGATIKRIRDELRAPQAEVVRRVFVLNENWSEQEVSETVLVMREQIEVGVTVRSIDGSHADAIAQDMNQQLQDFTIFDTRVPDLKYAGQYLLDELTPGAGTRGRRRVQVTSNPKTISALLAQFDKLWRSADAFSEGSVSKLLERAKKR